MLPVLSSSSLLVKSVRSVTSKSKKLYMLFDMVPSKEITGGPWYTEQEFDHEFVDELCNYIVSFIRSKVAPRVHY
jgi:DNA-directed RNA polymerase III subunit RPC6